MIYVYMS